MAYYGSIEITDAKGWSKTIPVEKARLMAGSADFNDLVLPEDHGGGVYPAHMQLFFSPGNPTRLRMVNLADTAMIAQRHLSDHDIVVPAKGSLQFQTGDKLIVGDFLLKFFLHAHSGIRTEARSEHLFMALELPRLDLRTEDSLVGRLQVVNHGELANCQFEFDLEGLDDSCYNIDPAPLLFPGSCEFLKIRFVHRGDTPQAGACQFTIRAYAPTSYPTEEVVISETLHVAPVYQYEVKIQDESQVAIQNARIELPPAPAPVQAAAPPPPPQPALVAPPPPVQIARHPEPEPPIQTAAPEPPQVAAPMAAAQPVTPAPNIETSIPPGAAHEVHLSPEVVQEIRPPAAPTHPADPALQPAAPQAPAPPPISQAPPEPAPPESPPQPPPPAREPLQVAPPENVIIEPPQQDLWAQDTGAIPRTTSATPVSRLGQVKKSALLSGAKIEILTSQDAEEPDEQDETGEEAD